jgi:hypothetical protein
MKIPDVDRGDTCTIFWVLDTGCEEVLWVIAHKG